jgi:hypothetical protein
MIGFDPISLTASMLLLAQSSGCPFLAAPTVSIALAASDAPLDTSMSMDELTAGFANNPDSTLSTESGWHLGGLTLSNIQTSYSAQYVVQHMSQTTGCVSVSHVDVTIIYTPVIYVATDFLDKQCQYDVTYAHEQRHVGTDLEVINDFTPLFEQRMNSYLANLGPQGPFYLNQMKDAQTNILDQLIADSQPISDELARVRRERQAAFDTEDNYRQENALCQGQD